MINKNNYNALLLEYESMKLLVKNRKMTKAKFLEALSDPSSPEGEIFRAFFDKISTKETRQREILDFMELVFKS